MSDSPPADGSGFGSSPEAACPLIEHGLQAGVLRFDGLDCDVPHADHSTDRGRKLDKLFWRDSLSLLRTSIIRFRRDHPVSTTPDALTFEAVHDLVKRVEAAGYTDRYGIHRNLVPSTPRGSLWALARCIYVRRAGSHPAWYCPTWRSPSPTRTSTARTGKPGACYCRTRSSTATSPRSTSVHNNSKPGRTKPGGGSSSGSRISTRRTRRSGARPLTTCSNPARTLLSRCWWSYWPTRTCGRRWRRCSTGGRAMLLIGPGIR